MVNQRTRSPGGWVLLALVLVAVTAAIGLVAFSLFQRAMAPPDDGQQIAAAFLDDLRSNRIDAAWAGTTAEFKSFMGRDRLNAYFRSHPILKMPAEFSEFREHEANGIPLMVYTFRVTSASAAIQVLLAREQGQWKVERLTVE